MHTQNVHNILIILDIFPYFKTNPPPQIIPGTDIYSLSFFLFQMPIVLLLLHLLLIFTAHAVNPGKCDFVFV